MVRQATTLGHDSAIVVLCLMTLHFYTQAYADEVALTKPEKPVIELLSDPVDNHNTPTTNTSQEAITDFPESYAPIGRSGDELIGWASVPHCGAHGTTGGGDGATTVSVSNAQELTSALTSSGPKMIIVEGTITDVGNIKNVKDKTLIGRHGAKISGGIRFTSARNVIVKNIEFADGSNDTFELSSSECIWFDHNTFRDGRDGNLDIVRGSNYVTVSWSRFYYTEAHDHMLSNLNGNTNNSSRDEGKIKVTFHHNWWGAGVQERMPRVRYGDTHIFNNYYKYEPIPGDFGQNYVIGAGQHSRLLVQNNYFEGSNKPIIFVADEGTAEIVHEGNKFVNTTGDIVQRGLSFIPQYGYVLDSAEDAAALIRSNAGPQ